MRLNRRTETELYKSQSEERVFNYSMHRCSITKIRRVIITTISFFEYEFGVGNELFSRTCTLTAHGYFQTRSNMQSVSTDNLYFELNCTETRNTQIYKI